MKILKIGEWEKRLNCRDCKSLLLFKVEDIQIRARETDAHEFIDEFYISCPVCSRENVIKVPTSIADKVRNK